MYFCYGGIRMLHADFDCTKKIAEMQKTSGPSTYEGSHRLMTVSTRMHVYILWGLKT